MTDEEIMQGLRACWEHKDCSKCPFVLNLNDCHSELAHEAYKEIERLQAENAALRENRIKAVKDVAERIKTAFYCEFEELIPSIMADKIDEVVKGVLK